MIDILYIKLKQATNFMSAKFLNTFHTEKANSVDPDEGSHYGLPYMDLSCIFIFVNKAHFHVALTLLLPKSR